MVQRHRFLFRQLRKWASSHSEHQGIPTLADFSGARKTRPTLIRLFFFFFLAVAFILLCFSSFMVPRTRFSGTEESRIASRASSSSCSSISNNSMCCDRSAFRTDICFLLGEVRAHSSSASLFVTSAVAREETIRPYTRKWETAVMSLVSELRLLTGRGETTPACDVVHSSPAVVFSTGGYTGNVFHEFNDGILPLYLTAHHHNRDVVLVILDYHNWWVSKYAEILAGLSRFPLINFSNDSRTHCFPSATVGLRIHDDLTIDPTRHRLNISIFSFRRLLDDAYRHRTRWFSLAMAPTNLGEIANQKPRLALLLRNGSRSLENEGEVVAMVEEMGFSVEVMRPERTTELAAIYMVLNHSEVMVGVHGAAMTHFLFMRPGSVFVQIVPLGTEWASETYYGAPARRMGLRYISYKVKVEESSLWREYGKEHPVVREPGTINARGWEETKRVYLERQNVRLDLGRFRRTMDRVRRYLEVRPTEKVEEEERN